MKIFLLLSILFLSTNLLLSQDDQIYYGPPIPYKKGANWGFSDLKGHIIIPPAYDRVLFFTERSMDKDYRYAKVAKYGKWGIIDDKGEVLLAPSYDTVSFTKVPHFVIIGNDNKFGGFSLKSGSSVPIEYNQISPITLSNRVVSTSYVRVRKGNKVGIASINGEEIVACQYDEIIYSQNFSGLSDSIKNSIRYKLIGKIGNEYYVFHDKGKRERIFPDDKIHTQESDNGIMMIAAPDSESERIAAEEESRKLNLIKDTLGLDQIKKIPFSNFFVTEKDSLFGLIEKLSFFKKKSGGGSILVDSIRQILPSNYDTIYDVRSYFTHKGEPLFRDPPWFIKDQKFKELILVKKEGESGVITDQEEVVYFPQEMELMRFINGLVILTRKNTKWGFINHSDANKSIKNEYDFISDEYDGKGTPSIIYRGQMVKLFWVRKGKLEGFLGTNGVEYFE